MLHCCRMPVESGRFHRLIRQLHAVGLHLEARHISAEQIKIIAVLRDISKRDAQDRLKQLGAKQAGHRANKIGRTDQRAFTARWITANSLLPQFAPFLGSICPLSNTCFRL
jgi:hypothetical protein